MRISGRHTWLLLVVLTVLLFGLRFARPFDAVISWDVKGYYLYLPALFIYDDPLIRDAGWVSGVQEKYQTAATLYMLNPAEKGGQVIKYTMGLSWLYAPMFFAGHAVALLSPGWPADGFSPPYQYALALGAFLYVFLGLFFLRKVLHTFFDNKTVFFTMLFLVAGTNLLNQFAFLTVLSHSFLFFLVSALLWAVIRFYRTAAESNHPIVAGDQPGKVVHVTDLPGKTLLRNYIAIALLCGFIALVRPTESVCFLLFLLWDAGSWKKVVGRLWFFFRRPLWIGLFALMVLLVVFPQLLYWKTQTGNWLYYSYDNPGEGLDLLAPHTLNFLFSFRKGWLVYTPLMWFLLPGMVNLFRHNKGIFLPVLLFFVASLYLMSSWTTWWYAGGCFSSRTIITTYPVLAIPLGYLVSYLLKSRLWLKTGALALALFFVFLNLFQSWQFQNGIITLETMTREYYFRSFLKRAVTDADREHLLVLRPLTTHEFFRDEHRYSSFFLLEDDLVAADFPGFRFAGTSGLTDGVLMVLDGHSPFSPVWEWAFSDLTMADHVWLRGEAKVYIPEDYTGPDPLLVMSFTHKGETYKYRTTENRFGPLQRGAMNAIRLDFITPELRSRSDRLLLYVWHRGDQAVYLDSISLEVFTRDR